jgi:uncharacterized protein (TIGR02996 family)
LNTYLQLLAGILAEPDEDTPRLALADYLDERDPHHYSDHVRAEFIRDQIWNRNELGEVTYLERGGEYLSGTTMSDWTFPTLSGEHPIILPPMWDWFIRGLIGHVECRASDWIHCGEKIETRHPIQALTITDLNGYDQSLSAHISNRIRLLRLRAAEFHQHNAYALVSYSVKRGWRETLKQLEMPSCTDQALAVLVGNLPHTRIRVGESLWSEAGECGTRTALDNARNPITLFGAPMVMAPMQT